MNRKVLVCLVALCGGIGAWADEAKTNLLRTAASHLRVSAFADVETAFWSRGKIVDKNPFSAQCVAADADLASFGRIGGNVWSACAMQRGGQSANRQNFFNEIDYKVDYGYGWEIVHDWTLDTSVGPKWVALPGYHPHEATTYEWNVAQALKNPYVTPYYLLRRAYYKAEWCYWDVGLMRRWALTDALALTVRAFGELGNSRLFRSRYGLNPRGEGYSNGLMALNLMARLDYAIAEWVGLFVFVHQFDVVSTDARAALDANPSPESVKDLTIGGIGLTLSF